MLLEPQIVRICLDVVWETRGNIALPPPHKWTSFVIRAGMEIGMVVYTAGTDGLGKARIFAKSVSSLYWKKY